MAMECSTFDLFASSRLCHEEEGQNRRKGITPTTSRPINEFKETESASKY